ncbi:MAG: hypothetical protein ACM37W_02450 [Actinomycetota bacterium]
MSKLKQDSSDAGIATLEPTKLSFWYVARQKWNCKIAIVLNKNSR